MGATIEREIKLRCPSVEAARAAALNAGALPLRDRRLQDDCLLDTPDMRLRREGSTLRVRSESGTSRITFKGPVQPAAMKVREEIEAVVGDGALVLTILERLGFRPWFRYQKYREEFSAEGCVVAVDDTPIGSFVEIEGSEVGITLVAEALGRGPSDYVLASYRALYVDHCQQRGIAVSDMLFS
jgi:adenylate cyclase, class 2